MNGWKKTFPPIGFAIAGLCFLFAGLEERVIDVGRIRYPMLSLAFLYLVLAAVFFDRGRKSGGGTGPPNA